VSWRTVVPGATTPATIRVKAVRAARTRRPRRGLRRPRTTLRTQATPLGMALTWTRMLRTPKKPMRRRGPGRRFPRMTRQRKVRPAAGRFAFLPTRRAIASRTLRAYAYPRTGITGFVRTAIAPTAIRIRRVLPERRAAHGASFGPTWVRVRNGPCRRAWWPKGVGGRAEWNRAEFWRRGRSAQRVAALPGRRSKAGAPTSRRRGA
jgi:hypothetical protein